MRIEKILIATAFKPDKDIILSWGKNLKKLQEHLKGKLIQLNIPELAPPEAPRVIIKSEDSLVNVSLNRVELITKPPDHVNSDIYQSLKFSRSLNENVFEIVQDVLNGYQWAGVVCHLNYPQKTKNANEASELVYDKITTIKRKNLTLSSFQFRFGFNENDFYKIFNFQGYESRNINFSFDITKNEAVSIDANRFPIDECGIQFILDYNNKPQSSKLTPKEDISKIICEIENDFKELPEKFNLKEVLK